MSNTDKIADKIVNDLLASFRKEIVELKTEIEQKSKDSLSQKRIHEDIINNQRFKIQKLLEALKNCRAMAAQQAHAFRGSITEEKWRAILRFCKEAGVEGSILRGCSNATHPIDCNCQALSTHKPENSKTYCRACASPAETGQHAKGCEQAYP